MDGQGYRGTIKKLLRWARERLMPAARPAASPRQLEQFDPEFYCRTYPDVAQSQIDPLTHYWLHGAHEGRDPNAWFCTRFYLEHYPEVAASGMNPLEHYLRIGRAEGLLPSPLYVPGRLDTQLSRLKGPARGRSVILLISHIGGGGTEKHLRDLQAWLRDRVCFYLLAPTNHYRFGASLKGTLHLSCFAEPDAGSFFFDPAHQLPDLCEVISELAVERVHLHHTLGHEAHLRDLLGQIGLPYDLTLHDYYLLSPHPHLLGPDGRYFGDPDDEVLAPPYQREGELVACGTWRDRFRWVWQDADRIIAPSHDVKARFLRYCDRSDIIVASHPEERAHPVPLAQPLASDDALRILVLGEMTPQKGAEVLEACSVKAREEGLPLRFHLLGEPYRPMATEPDANLVIHGAYRQSDLPDLIKGITPHVVWFPTQCPETYSYTLSETLSQGLPVVAPDLGAFPERLNDRPWSWIVPWDAAASELCATFGEVRQHFLRGVGPIPVAAPCAVQDTFYDEGYMRPLARLEGLAVSPEETIC